MSTKPFTWIVALTVAPEWVADGFSLGDERALNMLGRELDFADMTTELAATVLHAPSPLRVAREQGYGPKHPDGGRIVRELIDAAPNSNKLRDALVAAINLLDGVAFVKTEGDTAKPLAKLREAVALLDGDQVSALAA